MALKGVLIWGCYDVPPRLGNADLGFRRNWVSLSWKKDKEKACKWKCSNVLGGLSIQQETTSVEEENPSATSVELGNFVDRMENYTSVDLKEFNSLPSE
ncbi:hypothetical protein FRX31_033336 [Thalictrum thalictroides]|uniref:Uncharacterized protein n=1 Tax=Thalictrum thalictroides TaxID=46969 RepID=A0A7J6UWV3_THATH|nr:hypothetical protein FRX31_033336 [Thalictrum thalictroides]